MFGNKWRIKVDGEELEFADRKGFDTVLKQLVDLKDTHARILK